VSQRYGESPRVDQRRRPQGTENNWGQPTRGNTPASPEWVLGDRLTLPHLKKDHDFINCYTKSKKVDGRGMWHAWDRR